MPGPPLAVGLRRLLDSHQRFYRAGLQVFLRRKNFTPPAVEAVELGFQFAPTAGATGFNDTLVQPPPEVVEVTLNDIGLNNTRLFFGARKFKISHTFVLQQMAQFGYADAYQVFRDPSVIGIFYNQRLFSIESITHKETGGDIISWNLICNASEEAVNVT